MKVLAVFVALLVIPLLLVSSCSSVRSVTAYKASAPADEDWEKIAMDGIGSEEGWASKYVPGWKTLSEVVPEPTTARKKWDRYHKRKRTPWPDEMTGD